MKLKENVDLKVLEETQPFVRLIYNGQSVINYKHKGKSLYEVRIYFRDREVQVWKIFLSYSIKLKTDGKVYKKVIKDLIEKGLVE